jgi:hypothetical protein
MFKMNYLLKGKRKGNQQKQNKNKKNKRKENKMKTYFINEINTKINEKFIQR